MPRRAALAAVAGGVIGGALLRRGLDRGHKSRPAPRLAGGSRTPHRQMPVAFDPIPGRATIVPTDPMAELLVDVIPCWHSLKATRCLL